MQLSPRRPGIKACRGTSTCNLQDMPYLAPRSSEEREAESAGPPQNVRRGELPWETHPGGRVRHARSLIKGGIGLGPSSSGFTLRSFSICSRNLLMRMSASCSQTEFSGQNRNTLLHPCLLSLNVLSFLICKMAIETSP